MSSYFLDCRGEILELPQDEFIYINSDWFLANLINDLDFDGNPEFKKPIKIYEEKMVVQSIIDSLRYKRIIIHKGVSLRYLQALADKWCLPDWFQSKITKKTYITKYLEKQLDYVILKECVNCGATFNMLTNTENSCHRHTKQLKANGVFECCGNVNKCTTGYHMFNGTDPISIKQDIDKIRMLIDLIHDNENKDIVGTLNYKGETVD